MTCMICDILKKMETKKRNRDQFQDEDQNQVKKLSKKLPNSE